MKWSYYNSSNSSNSKYLNSFVYTSSDDLETLPYLGIYSNYFGGGYVHKFKPSQASLESMSQDFLNLENFKWIDSQTRAIFIEFSLYNVNLNVFAYCTILFELLPTGNFLKTMRFQPVLLYEPLSFQTALILIINFVYIIFIVFFMIKEIRSIYKKGFEYFLDFWIYLEWILFAFAWASFVIYFYRFMAKQDISEKLKNTSTKMIKMQLLSYWNETLGYLFGCSVFFGTLKFLKLLRFSKKICLFMRALKRSLLELTGFTIIFLIYWLAFAQIMYLIQYDRNSKFSTFIASMESTFLMFLNHVPKEMQGETFVILINILFYLIVVFILINLLVSIITENFDFVRKNKDKEGEEEEDKSKLVLEYLRKKFRNLVAFLKNSKNKDLDDDDDEKIKSEKFAIHMVKLNSDLKRLIDNLQKNGHKNQSDFDDLFESYLNLKY